MSRPPLSIGTFGKVTVTRSNSGWTAKARYRHFDGLTRLHEANASTKAGAERALKIKFTSITAPTYDELTADTRVRHLADKWIAQIQDSSRADNTKQRYSELVRPKTATNTEGYIITGLGNLQLRDVNVSRLESFLEALSVSHGRGTAKLARTCLIGMFTLARRHDAVPQNFARDTRAITAKPVEVKALSAAQVHDLMRKIRAHPRAVDLDLVDLFEALLATGARFGEILALRWQDVDMATAKPTVTITGTVVYVRGRGNVRQPQPKSRSGFRTLTLPLQFVATLMRRHAELIEPNQWDVIFPSQVNTLRDASNVRRQWNDIRAEMGYDWVTPKTLRKTVATIIANEHNSLIASKQLGHASPGVTEGHYIQRSHEAPDVRDALDSLSTPD